MIKNISTDNKAVKVQECSLCFSYKIGEISFAFLVQIITDQIS